MNDYQKYIQVDPKIKMGKPVVKDTRITVGLILQKLAKGGTMQQLLESHLRLTKEAIYAALLFASHVLMADVVYPIAS